MQLNPMNYNNTTEKVKMVRAPASTDRGLTRKQAYNKQKKI